ncbi:hypothetical protein GPECTOR_6g798 [Gonium pectorale]|uniref:heme oxygenase (biliverdin-producing) n=1 Tax=Gonium pectorale TaxID=33097 RepID=A0A150GWY1_GONPE|nr:hypothetical protein GPECTOR_6g798 [Gonium pectorale]|eukprot:KXZ53880.1 hypothetical protein GPECTOR_6g798 [Gonium pectorale]
MLIYNRNQVHSRAGRKAPCASAPRRVVRVVCFGQGHGHGHGHGHGQAAGGTAVLTEKEKGFVAEMRKVAMKLHTKEQAPKEGQKEAPKQGPWTPTREGYLRFLTESKAVFDAFERLMETNEEYASFRKTGLERSAGLAEDLAWFERTYQMTPPALAEDGPGLTYVRLLEKVAKEDPPAFICHYYNFYFAHTAGGIMIGKRVSSMVLDSHTLEFYKWHTGDVNVMLDGVRRSINIMAESWSDAAKAHCLEETEASFKYSGLILQCITATA